MVRCFFMDAEYDYDFEFFIHHGAEGSVYCISTLITIYYGCLSL